MKYETIVKNIQTGKHVRIMIDVWHAIEEVSIIWTRLDSKGDIIYFIWEGGQHIHTEDIVHWGQELFKVLPPPIKRFKKGDRVMVMDNTKEVYENFSWWWGDVKDDMVGKVFNIDKENTTLYQVNWYNFPPECLCYVDEEVLTIEDIEKSVDILRWVKTLTLDGKEYNLVPKE